MGKEGSETGQLILKQWLMTFIGLPWIVAVDKLWPIGQKILQNFVTKGVYEVTDYESTLEIKDRSGTKATFNKRKKIRYLQDDVIAYQDYAWGDGDILLNYHTNRGKPVDRYKSGFKTNGILSLREVKNRGDIGEFIIQWTSPGLSEGGWLLGNRRKPTHETSQGQCDFSENTTATAAFPGRK
ncbi:MAG: hypothetical protein MUO64_20845 [Anaerolineales bacterium]|nr:hypothetical protein [Anaerolineales bacterium]